MHFRLVIIACILSACTVTTFDLNLPDIGLYYQDLTTQIDNALRNGDTNSTEILQSALNRSTCVYYASDMPMNQILNMLTIIDLLEQLKPKPESKILIMLSLRYTSENRFARPTHDDVFYDRYLKITVESMKRLQAFITGIVLDFSTKDNCEEAYYFYSKPGHNKVYLSFSWYTFPQFIKSFIHFYCDHSDDCNIPVGVALDSSQIKESENCVTYYLKAQVDNADFYVLTAQFPAYSGFPLTTSEFWSQINTMTTGNQVLTSYAGRFTKKVYINLNMDSPATRTAANITSQWNTSLQNLLSSSPYYNYVVQNLIENAYWQNFQLLLHHSNPTNLYRYLDSYEEYGFILGNTLEPLVSKLQLTGHSEENAVIIANMDFATGWGAGKYICDLVKHFIKNGGGDLYMGKDIWSAYAGHKSQLASEDTIKCKLDGYSVNKVELVDNKAILYFDYGIHQSWSAIHVHMDKLVSQCRKLGRTTLDALVFHEDDLAEPPQYELSTGYEAQSGQIAKFVRKWDSHLKTGCIVTFTENIVEKLDRKSETVAFESFQKRVVKICEPIFDIMDTMIWKMPMAYSDLRDVSGKHDDIVAARNVFLKEFPHLTILLKFGYNGDFRIEDAKNWARYYGVPVLFKLSLIHN